MDLDLRPNSSSMETEVDFFELINSNKSTSVSIELINSKDEEILELRKNVEDLNLEIMKLRFEKESSPKSK